jgi:hypothetical protein
MHRSGSQGRRTSLTFRVGMGRIVDKRIPGNRPTQERGEVFRVREQLIWNVSVVQTGELAVAGREGGVARRGHRGRKIACTPAPSISPYTICGAPRKPLNRAVVIGLDRWFKSLSGFENKNSH